MSKLDLADTLHNFCGCRESKKMSRQNEHLFVNLFSLPAQKPASVPGGSGAGLAGNPTSANSQMLDDLRYAADNFVSHHDEVDANLREFAASLIGAGISPPAQKPASVPGGSGALLAGNPLTMSGDAWEAAAHHVIAIREKRQSNGDTWRQIGQFLDSMPKAGS